MSGSTVEGAQVLVEALKAQGVKFMFGVVGIPVLEVAVYAQQAGIHYIGMRNEQAAAYAAQAVGYLTGVPGACLCVSGPGVLHAVAGLANAQCNGWPLLLLGGASDTDQGGMGAFQECDQVSACRLYTKYCARPPSIPALHYHVAQAVKCAVTGRPGAAYLDLPGDLLRGHVPREEVLPLDRVPSTQHPCAPPSEVVRAAAVLLGAKRPLVVVGKGAAMAGAERAVRELLSGTNLPFLPTPMGKGVASDYSLQCVASCRTAALAEADVLLLLGARTNWMLHFVRAPRCGDGVKVVQVDLCAEEHNTSITSAVSLVGDVGAVCRQLTDALMTADGGTAVLTPDDSPWWQRLRQAMEQNAKGIEQTVSAGSTPPLGYYAVFDVLAKELPPDCIVCSEGANTMDIGRSFLKHRSPRHRLDAGTFGTMGVGLGFGIAAAVVEAANVAESGAGLKRVVCVEGDSAFGFSGMELETMSRYRLPIIVVVVNNNGIYSGVTEPVLQELREGSAPSLATPPTALLPGTRYDRLMAAFGGIGYHCTTLTEIKEAVRHSLQHTDGPSLIHIEIDPFAQRKTQKFDWLTRTAAKL